LGAGYLETNRKPGKIPQSIEVPTYVRHNSALTKKEVTKMKNKRMKISMLATPLMLVCGLLAPNAFATSEQDSDGACSIRTLRGDYGFSADGALLGIPGLPPEAPFRSVGVAHFDGKGKLTWVEHTVVNGMPLNVGWVAASGTYTVNPNCTGTAVVNSPNSMPPLNLNFAVVKQGKEIHTVLDSNAIASVFIKVE
jgi:hypothetical protein